METYSKVLEGHGISPGGDYKIYKSVVEIALKGRKTSNKSNNCKKNRSIKHYERTLKGKCYVGWLTWLLRIRRFTTNIDINNHPTQRTLPSPDNKENINNINKLTYVYQAGYLGKSWRNGELSTAPDSSQLTMEATKRNPSKLLTGSSKEGNSSLLIYDDYLLVSPTPQQLSDGDNIRNYSLALKSFRSLILHMRHSQAISHAKQKAIENWLVAMHFYNTTLATKGFICLIHNTKSNYKLELCANEVANGYTVRLLRKYFHIWDIFTSIYTHTHIYIYIYLYIYIDKRLDLEKRKEEYIKEAKIKRREEIFRIWYDVCGDRRVKLEEFASRLAEKPYSIYLLLVYITPKEMRKNSEGMTSLESQFENLCEFYRFMPNRGYLIWNLFKSLKIYAICSIFKTWKAHTKRIVNSRRFHKKRVMKDGFLALNNNAYIRIERRAKVESSAQTRTEKLKEKIIFQLRNYTLRKLHLRRSSAIIKSSRYRSILLQSLDGWLTQILNKQEKKSQNTVIRKYLDNILCSRVFTNWKHFTHGKLAKKSKFRLAIVKYYSGILGKVLAEWNLAANYQRQLKKRINLYTIWRLNRNKAYFYENWRNTYQQVILAKKNYNKSILKNSFKVLYERYQKYIYIYIYSSELRKIKISMLENMETKHTLTLLIKTFVPWGGYARRKAHNRLIFQIINRRKNLYLEQSVFNAICEYSRIQIVHKLNDQKSALHYLQGLVIKTFFVLKNYSQGKVEYKQKLISIKNRRCHIVKKIIFNIIKQFAVKQKYL